MARNRLYEDDVLVIGLGRFGQAAAMELQRLGHRVSAIERDQLRAEQFVGRLTRVVQADASATQAIERIRARDFRVAVVAIGSSIEASVLAAANLVDAGIPSIWGKARTPEHARILTRIGVHHVVRPEHESGLRVAHLLNGKLQDYIEFEDGFAIVKMHPPQEMIGFTLDQSRIRSKYGVTVVGVKRVSEDFAYAVPETRVGAQDTLIVSGPTELIERLASRP